MVSLNPYSLRVNFCSGDLQHPIGRNPFFVTKDKVSLRISIDGLVRFCSPIDPLQVPKTWSGPCNNFTVSWNFWVVWSQNFRKKGNSGGGTISENLLFGWSENSIIGRQERMTPATVLISLWCGCENRSRINSVCWQDPRTSKESTFFNLWIPNLLIQTYIVSW